MQEMSNQNIDQQDVLAFFEAYKRKFVSSKNYELFDACKEQFTRYYSAVYINTKPNIEDISTLAPFIIKFTAAELSHHEAFLIALQIEEYLKNRISKDESALLNRPDLLCEYIYTSPKTNMHLTHKIGYWTMHGDLLIKHPQALLAILLKFRQDKALGYFLDNIDPTFPQAVLLRTLCKLAKTELTLFKSTSLLSNITNSLKFRQSKADILNVCIELFSSSKLPQEATVLISSFYLFNHFPELKKLSIEFFVAFLNKIKEEMLVNELAFDSINTYKTKESNAQIQCIKDIIISGLKSANEQHSLPLSNLKFRKFFTQQIKMVNFEAEDCVNQVSNLAKNTIMEVAKNRYQTFTHPKMPLEKKEPPNDNAVTTSP